MPPHLDDNLGIASSPAAPVIGKTLDSMNELLGRIGTLDVRLARNASEIAAAQNVRFQVFYDELGAKRSLVHEIEARDADRFDDVCDHLIVLDTSIAGPDHERIVATYRLLPGERAKVAGGFYSENEFAIGELVARHHGRRFLELGRSCVLPAYRSRRSVELLWQGIWAYCRQNRIDVMTGCASFPGTVPAAHAMALTWLWHNCRASGEWYVRALSERYHGMDLMPVEALDPRMALAAMPPLLKGYLRIGGRIGDGAVVDFDFGTTDVFVVLPVEALDSRYVSYYRADASRFAA
jgi:L-ornithine Nalpha-acyltransferase